jgi:hypothetical protein
MFNESRDPTAPVKYIFLNLENIFKLFINPASGLRLPSQHRMEGVLEINHDAAVFAVKFAQHSTSGLNRLTQFENNSNRQIRLLYNCLS